MRRVFAVTIALTIGALGAPVATQMVAVPPSEPAAQAVSGDPLGGVAPVFVENRGQADEALRFLSVATEPAIAFTDDGVRFSLSGRESRAVAGFDFAGANPGVAPTSQGRAPTLVSYLGPGSDPSTAGIPTSSAIAYREVWSGIDAVYRGAPDSLKYRFEVAPGADPGQIDLRLRGATDATVTSSGQLRIETSAGTLVDDTPIAYQLDAGTRIPVPAAYSLDGDRVGFELGGYDPSLPLVVDPAVYVNAGYVGGAGDEARSSVAVTSTGEAIVAGSTISSEASFPDGDGFNAVSGADQAIGGASDAFAVKVDAAGTSLLYATYIGGGSIDEGWDVAVDPSENAYVVGRALGAGIPTATSFDSSHNGSYDAFVVKLNSTGTAISYGGFLGGSSADYGYAIDVDSTGRAYIAGETQSSEATFPDGDSDMNETFPVSGFDITYNGGTTDGFFARINAGGTALEYASYVGGGSFETALDIAVDSSNRAYVGGNTPSDEATFPDGDPGDSDTFPAGGFDQEFNGVSDGYLLRLDSTGTTLEYGTFIGGLQYDEVAAIDVSGGQATVGGRTLSNEADFPDGTDDPVDGDAFDGIPTMDGTFNGVADGWVGRFFANGLDLVYVGYIGGGADDEVSGIGLDAQERAWATGAVSSDQTTFPDGNGFGSVTGPDEMYNLMKDGFAARIDASGTALDYATYIGGNQADEGLSVAVDTSGHPYVAGITKSDQGTFPDGNDFPNDGNAFDDIPGSDQTFNDDPSENDAFLVELAIVHTLSAATNGTGSGMVTATGIDCPGDCSQDIPEGVVLAVTATPDAGSYLAGWSGDCSGTGGCSVTMDQDRAVTATFGLLHTLTVTKGGSGSGTVSGTGIACGGDCTQTYVEGSNVGVTATPDAGSYLAGWSGDCSGTGACSVTMDQDRTVTAMFETVTAKSVALSANKAKVKKGKKVMLTATVSPCAGHEGDTIDLMRNGAPFATATSDQACTAVFSVKMRRKATFRAVSTMQDADHSEGRSPEVPVKVKKPKRN